MLRLLLGELAPDSGTVRRGSNVEIAYYDQQREALDPERTVFDTIGDGNDTVTVDGRSRHVHGYLADFLFPRERAASPVKALSGGERNRLTLARLFTRPANVLVLDEPTNDLDIETLELLEQQLTAWSGTLLLVSHDRLFLDNVVTSTFAFEGGGRIQEYVGGYEDWLRQRPAPMPVARPADAGPARQPQADTLTATAVKPRKLTYKEQRELEGLPLQIEALEEEERALNARVSGSEFYKEGGDAIKTALGRLEELQGELASAYARWDELDGRMG
jgi:ATP-binding cassette subfamily F protein uup